jgi:hypothetical protein
MKKFQDVSRALITTAAVVMGQAGLAFAQGDIRAPKFGQSNLEFSAIIVAVGNWILTIAGALAVVYLIYGGIMYIIGGEKGADKAKVVITNAIIGLVIIAIASTIVALVKKVLQA